VNNSLQRSDRGGRREDMRKNFAFSHRLFKPANADAKADTPRHVRENVTGIRSSPPVNRRPVGGVLLK